MASRIKLSFDTNLFDEYLEDIEKLSGGELMNAVEEGLVSAKSEINNSIVQTLSKKSNLPQKGKYSDGTAIEGIDKDFNVKWYGSFAEIDVGFNWYKLGIEGQVLIYGLPHQKPVRGLKALIKGTKAKDIVNEEVQKAIDEAIARRLG